MMPVLVQHDDVTARQRDLLAALLDHETPSLDHGLPPLGHWLLFPPDARQSAIGADGHPLRETTPDDPTHGLPRRMWAGSRIRFHDRLIPGMCVRRETEQIDLRRKQGRSGDMAFMTLRHRILDGDTLLVEEEQDLVYRQAAQPGQPARPPAPPTRTPLPPVARSVCVDPVQLFRFSALTFNAHRIHYDRAYAVEQEGYAGLVVHGPFVATLLMDHFLRQSGPRPIVGFSFRAMRPLFDGEIFTLGLTPDENGGSLCAIGPDGGLAVEARVDIA